LNKTRLIKKTLEIEGISQIPKVNKSNKIYTVNLFLQKTINFDTLKCNYMEIITIKVKKQSLKATQLLNLIHEMAKDGDLQIQKLTTFNEVRKGIRELKQGKVKPIEELFK